MLGALIIVAVIALALAVGLVVQADRHAKAVMRLHQAHSMDYGAFVARVVSSDSLAIAPSEPVQPARSLERLYFSIQEVIRSLTLRATVLDFDSVLFVKRAPGTLPHMSDQYYGWWSRPGGSICILEGLRTGRPRVRSITPGWPDGSFLRPDLSYDGKRVLFAYCRHYPRVASMEKVDKTALPEDAFYNIYEMRSQEENQLKGWYCNISRPARITADTLTFDDLALDLLVFPDGRQRVLDEDEFAELNLSAADVQAATSALAELQHLFKDVESFTMESLML